MIKGFSAPLLSSLAISNRSVAGTWGCGWMRGEEEEQSRMLNMSSRPQRRRREGGQHGRLFTLCLSPLLRGSLCFFFFFFSIPLSISFLSLSFFHSHSIRSTLLLSSPGDLLHLSFWEKTFARSSFFVFRVFSRMSRFSFVTAICNSLGVGNVIRLKDLRHRMR